MKTKSAKSAAKPTAKPTAKKPAIQKKDPPLPVTEIKRLAAAAYGEADPIDNPDEIAGIAWAVANRARASKKTITKMLAKPGYVYATNGSNKRYNKLIKASAKEIAADKGMSLAMEAAKNASEKNGTDPSNGAYFWDGLDFKTNPDHYKKQHGFHYSNPAHNIFGVEESRISCKTTYERINKKTKLSDKIDVSNCDYVWESTAAHGKTIFWKYGKEWLRVSGGRDYG